ncbi:hypothetical protein C8Q73DRAFT_236185 [Cubamyces lactineus]|nr:hypothetical protein C8Q73DRAFT_236185 [Cubamyces lactineus]
MRWRTGARHAHTDFNHGATSVQKVTHPGNCANLLDFLLWRIARRRSARVAPDQICVIDIREELDDRSFPQTTSHSKPQSHTSTHLHPKASSCTPCTTDAPKNAACGSSTCNCGESCGCKAGECKC